MQRKKKRQKRDRENEILGGEASPSPSQSSDAGRSGAGSRGSSDELPPQRGSGLRELDWSGALAACRALVAQVSARFDAELVVGVAKGGIFAGKEIAASLKIPFVAVRVHHRNRDQLAQGGSEPARSMPEEAAGLRVLLVDDVAGTGATLEAAREALIERGAAEIQTATVITRKSGFRPDFTFLETDDLVVLPWDLEPTTGAVGSLGDDEDDEDEVEA